MSDLSFEPISLQVWTERANTHHHLISPWTNAYTKRKSIGEANPIYDFLFTYYNCSPLKLQQWVPSFEEGLIVTPKILEDFPWLNTEWFCVDENILSYKRERFSQHLNKLTSFIYELCDKIIQRPPKFGCFGLHEWAMVYRLSQEQTRHSKYKLRLSPEELNTFVESQILCCTHYDAYRFFTKEASPLNILQPTLETRLKNEQGGCVHTNMDLYKWSSKLWPWIGSDFIAKTFFLALKARELDMRASPYDLRDAGFEPICIENEEGKRIYQMEQQHLAKEANVLRVELRGICERLMD